MFMFFSIFTGSWLHWVRVAVLRFSPAALSGAALSLWPVGCPGHWLRVLRSTGSRVRGLSITALGFQRSGPELWLTD